MVERTSYGEIDGLARRWAALYSEHWLMDMCNHERAEVQKWTVFSSRFKLTESAQAHLDERKSALATAERALEVARLGKDLKLLYARMAAAEQRASASGRRSSR